MKILRVGNLYIAYAPGMKRIPGEYKLYSQAITAYKEFISANIKKVAIISEQNRLPVADKEVRKKFAKPTRTLHKRNS